MNKSEIHRRVRTVAQRLGEREMNLSLEPFIYRSFVLVKTAFAPTVSLILYVNSLDFPSLKDGWRRKGPRVALGMGGDPNNIV